MLVQKPTLFCCLFLLATLFGKLQAQSAKYNLDKNSPSIQQDLVFIENKGQWDSQVLYLARMKGLDTWITQNGVQYDFYQVEKPETPHQDKRALTETKFQAENATKTGHKVWMRWQNANKQPIPQGKEKQEGYYNYLIGNDPSKHASYVGLYKEILLSNVYEGIDIRYYFDKGYLRYDYVVKPYTDPSQIQIAFEGENESYIKQNNTLVFTTRFGEVEIGDLNTYYSQGGSVSSRFEKKGKGFGISLSSYDNSKSLIIDPLIYSTYLGGSGDEESGSGIVIDSSGNAFVTGYTYTTNFDITAGAYQTTHGGGFADVFVTKLNPMGTALIYSTYLGGSDEDYGYAIAIDDIGNAFVTGMTTSTNFDVTLGAYQTTYGGYIDFFVTKLNPTGTALVYSTYLGGNGEDKGYGIAIDASGNSFVTGYTASTDFDVTLGAYQTTYGGGEDGFVIKLNPTGTAFVYSTYLGGSMQDFGYGIAIDASGNGVVTGCTYSLDFDTTAGAYQTTHGGGFADVFITKLDSTGTALIYSTYLGGSGRDGGCAIAIDGIGNAFVTGNTYSLDFDTTAGAYQTTFGGGSYDAFVSKLNPTGTDLVYSTYLGGSNVDYSYAIAIDAVGNSFVTGETGSYNFDITVGAYQTTYGGSGGWHGDAFVTKLYLTGTALVYSTYLGGSGDDYSYAIAIDGVGNAFVTGGAGSNDFDITVGAYQTNYGGWGDVFVTKLFTPIFIAGVTQPFCINDSGLIDITMYGTTGPYTYSWSNGATTEDISGLVPGSYTITIIDINGDTITETWTILSPSPITVNLSVGDTAFCGYTYIYASASGGYGGFSYQWYGPVSDTTSNLLCSQTGNYYVVVSDSAGCSQNSDNVNITINPLPPTPTISLNGFTLSSSGTNVSWQWYLNGSPIAGANQQSYTATQNGSYTVAVTNAQGCTSQMSAVMNITNVAIENPILSGIKVYPNPAQNTLSIDFGNLSFSYLELSIIDAAGRMVFAQSSNAAIQGDILTLDVSKLVAGIYMVKINMDSGLQTVKLLKN